MFFHLSGCFYLHWNANSEVLGKIETMETQILMNFHMRKIIIFTKDIFVFC